MDNALHLQIKRIVVDRLEHVIHCVDFKGRDSILSKLCNKNKQDVLVKLTELFCSVHPVKHGHFDIHQDQIPLRGIVCDEVDPVFINGGSDIYTGLFFKPGKMTLEILGRRSVIFDDRNIHFCTLSDVKCRLMPY